MLLVAPDIDARREARTLYWIGWPVPEIAARLNVPEPTVRSWKGRDDWDQTPIIQRVESCTEAKYLQLLLKEPKSGADVRDLDLLGRQIERFARIRRYGEPGGHEGDLNPKVANRNAAPKKKAVKNHFTAEQLEQLKANFFERIYAHQRLWWDNRDNRTRMILKSRQTGATFYFAFESLIDAVETGRNKVFLSASKNQAHIFRQYIQSYAAEVGVELTGDPIVINRGEGEPTVTLYFLGSNFRTAQGYHGDFFFDEFFWALQFEALNKLASGMATHKHWRKTYASTPSSLSHPAYPLWSGERFNKGRPKEQKVTLDLSHAALQHGQLGPDRIWRNILTIDDAFAGGMNDKFDIDELKLEYNPDDYGNLYLCQFIDDALSVFPLATLQKCQVDMIEDWDDYHFGVQRPIGNAPCWLGYDPAATGDAAALMVVARPKVLGQSKFRLVHKESFRGLDFTAQADAIEALTHRFNIEAIDIDATGIGLAVHQLVRGFFPAARGHQYTPEVKTRLVLKAFDVFGKGRLEYDAGWSDVTAAFLSIRRAMTAGGRAMTYEAGRTEESGHADFAWATMHALDNEPLEAGQAGGARGSIMEIY